MDYEQNKELEKDASRDDVIQDGIKTQTYVLEKGADHWAKLLDWNESNNKLTSKELGILDTACKMPRKIPSEAQCHILIDAEKRSITEGFYPG